MTLDQRKLDIVDRQRASLLGWRGQFSPELIEYFLDTYCSGAQRVLDPFCGSGTVLSESLRRNLNAVGIDVNPAAFVLSTVTDFLEAPTADRLNLVRAASAIVDEAPSNAVVSEILESVDNSRLKQLLHIAAVVGCGDRADFGSHKLRDGLKSVGRIFRDFPHSNGRTLHILGDAREEIDKSPPFDAIITSPPYINVFNYHQNYRAILEHLGWSPLAAANAEIGANRKFRQNRFLTVVQYCLDMRRLVWAARRAITDSGVFIIVIGRESNVLRTPFYNADIFRQIIRADGLFSIDEEHERRFTNRFGSDIYEDVIVMSPAVRCPQSFGDEPASALGKEVLQKALRRVPAESRYDLSAAIRQAAQIKPSPSPKLRYSPLWPPRTAEVISLPPHTSANPI